MLSPNADNKAPRPLIHLNHITETFCSTIVSWHKDFHFNLIWVEVGYYNPPLHILFQYFVLNPAFSNHFLLFCNIHTKISLKLAPKWTTSTVSVTLVILCWETCRLLYVQLLGGKNVFWISKISLLINFFQTSSN